MSTEIASDPMNPSLSAPEKTTTAASVAPRVGTARRRWIALGVAAVALASGGALLASRHGAGSPAKAAEASDTPRVEGDRIAYSPAFAERAGIRLVPVDKSQLVPVVTAVGTVDFNPEHVAAVGTRLRGLVSRVVKFEGDTVEKGDVMAVIDSAELGEAQAAVSMLEAEKHAADVNLRRENELSQKNLTTQREAEVASVEAQKYQLLLGAARQKVSALAGGVGSRPSGRLGAHELRAPIKGTIVARGIAPGQSVESNLVAFRVANINHLWVELDVFEKNLAKIRLGDRVELSPLAAPQEVFEGRVARIGALIDADTRSAPVRVEVDNHDRRLRAGQAVNARIHAAGGEHASTQVPSSAITYVDGKPTLFVASGNNSVRVVKVELGITNGHETEITSGVNPGDQVVSEGVFALKSELFR
ncbi:MAG TPA: efflux RND transporter periplasmic adaptor subunit [Polyangiaceae bacterium]|nr:efflux RND transporter periplasmic adaptor subunit [Polyangiaceae bacterium]